MRQAPHGLARISHPRSACVCATRGSTAFATAARRARLGVVLVAVSLAILPRPSPAASSPIAPPKPGGPRAQFSGTVVDFGRVMPTEIRKHEYIVANDGTATLVITHVAPGCGCTTTGTWDKEIPPGQTGRIPIEFNPSTFSGAIVKSIVVETNEAVQSSHVLEIRANVWRPFEIHPAHVAFMTVEGEPREETRIVRILNNLDQPATLEPPVSTNPLFRGELKTIRPGQQFELHLAYDSSKTGPSLNTEITVKTSLAEQPVLTVAAFAMSQPAVMAIPNSIELPPGPRGQNYSHNLVIRNNSQAALKIIEATASVPKLAIKVTEPQPGRMFYVNVAIPDDFVARAEAPAIITVRTSHPRFPEIRVPVMPSAVPPPPLPPTAAVR
ncbi:MAG: DUF1573 domain-containing protein [Verrucomicrobia bacterium]|nr:DUF1573 domain-containing protein [Verrucomicrobiota bacterium]